MLELQHPPLRSRCFRDRFTLVVTMRREATLELERVRVGTAQYPRRTDFLLAAGNWTHSTNQFSRLVSAAALEPAPRTPTGVAGLCSAEECANPLARSTLCPATTKRESGTSSRAATGHRPTTPTCV